MTCCPSSEYLIQVLQQSLPSPELVPASGVPAALGAFALQKSQLLGSRCPFPVCLSLHTEGSLRAGTTTNLALRCLLNPFFLAGGAVNLTE